MSQLPGKTTVKSYFKNQRLWHHWTVEEKKALVSAIRDYGSQDANMLSEAIKTKTADEVKYLLNRYKTRARARLQDAGIEADKENAESHGKGTTGQGLNTETSKSLAPLDFWAEACKKFVDQKYCIRKQAAVFESLFREAADAACLEPRFSGEPDFQEVYNYFAALLSGSVAPPQLTPAGFLLVSRLFDDLAAFVVHSDWQEEKMYFQSVFGPPEFVHVKSEATSSKETTEASLPSLTSHSVVTEPGAVPQIRIMMPSELHDSLLQNKGIQECINPFCIPKNFLQKEQKVLATFYSNMRK